MVVQAKRPFQWIFVNCNIFAREKTRAPTGRRRGDGDIAHRRNPRDDSTDPPTPVARLGVLMVCSPFPSVDKVTNVEQGAFLQTKVVFSNLEKKCGMTLASNGNLQRGHPSGRFDRNDQESSEAASSVSMSTIFFFPPFSACTLLFSFPQIRSCTDRRLYINLHESRQTNDNSTSRQSAAI